MPAWYTRQTDALGSFRAAAISSKVNSPHTRAMTTSRCRPSSLLSNSFSSRSRDWLLHTITLTSLRRRFCFTRPAFVESQTFIDRQPLRDLKKPCNAVVRYRLFRCQLYKGLLHHILSFPWAAPTHATSVGQYRSSNSPNSSASIDISVAELEANTVYRVQKHWLLPRYKTIPRCDLFQNWIRFLQEAKKCQLYEMGDFRVN